MQLKKFLFFSASFGFLFLAAGRTQAQDLQSVLSRMDAAAAKFHTTSATFEFITAQTHPAPDTDTQKGTVYYKRQGSSFQGGVHIDTDDGDPAPKIVVCCDGGLKVIDQKLDEVTTLSKYSQFGSYFILGFGASGKELADKWDIKYDGPETVDGVRTDKLELTAKDSTVRSTIPKVIVWMDTDRAVSIKQYFDEGGGQSRTCHYTNIKVNQSLPKDAFTFATDKKTTYSNK